MGIFNFLFPKKKTYFKDDQSLHNAHQFASSDVVKSMKVYTAEDNQVCDYCKTFHGKVFPFITPKDKKFVIDNTKLKGCTNPQCRCYWRPEDISI